MYFRISAMYLRAVDLSLSLGKLMSVAANLDGQK
jgi:hypothetical protein